MGKLQKKLIQKWKKKLKKLKAAYKVAETSKDKKRKAYQAACKACIKKHKDKRKAWKAAAKISRQELKAYKKALKAWKKINQPEAKQDNNSKGKPQEVLIIVEKSDATPSSPGKVVTKVKSVPKSKSKPKPKAIITLKPKAAPTTNTNAKDSLRKIEGIGPKIEELLHNAGILTFRHLAKAKIDRLKQVLSEAGARYRMHNPTTWPEQSALAADGRWDDLKALQIELKGGRKV